jgi:hypothetical protein
VNVKGCLKVMPSIQSVEPPRHLFAKLDVKLMEVFVCSPNMTYLLPHKPSAALSLFQTRPLGRETEPSVHFQTAN